MEITYTIEIIMSHTTAIGNTDYYWNNLQHCHHIFYYASQMFFLRISWMDSRQNQQTGLCACVAEFWLCIKEFCIIIFKFFFDNLSLGVCEFSSSCSGFSWGFYAFSWLSGTLRSMCPCLETRPVTEWVQVQRSSYCLMYWPR